MHYDLGLAGRTVAVTGGASGIGLRCVQTLAAAGAKVAVLDVNREQLDAAVAPLRAAGGAVLALDLDVRDAGATEDAFARIEADLGPLDGLIAAAGVARSAPATMLTPEMWDLVIGVNLTGLFHTVQAAGKRMVTRGRGAIVTFGSTSSVGGQAGRAAYCASKAGVVGLTRDLAIEWGSYGVRINAVGPSLTDTPMVRNGIPQKFLDDIVADRTPLGRMADPQEVANTCMFLLSDLSSYITGTLLMVDGGVTAGAFTAQKGRDFSSRAMLAQGIYRERD